MNYNYGIQMYSLRDMVDQDMDSALRAVAEMGYTSVEFAGFAGHTAEEIRDMLIKYNLKLSGTHSKISALLQDFEGTMKYHTTIGNTKYIVPHTSLDTREQLETFIKHCNYFAPRMREYGIELGFHNHSGEFKVSAEGFYAHKELEERADIFFELDTYWVFAAGLDPLATMERLKDRTKVIHLKDSGVSLGSGNAPIKAVRDKATELGIEIVVESEGCNPTGREEVQRCMDYLRTID